MDVMYTENGIKIFQTTNKNEARTQAKIERLNKFSYLGSCVVCQKNEWYTSHADCIYCTRQRDKKNRANKIGRDPKRHIKHRAEKYAEMEMLVRTLAFKHGLMDFGLDMDTQKMRSVIEFGKDLLVEVRLMNKEAMASLLAPRPAQQWLDLARQAQLAKLGGVTPEPKKERV